MNSILDTFFGLQGRTALVTGGAAGMGYGIARALALAGARLVIADRDAQAAEIAVAKLREAGCEARAYIIDLSQESEIAPMFDAARRYFGTVDILVNNAGIVVGKAFADYTHAQIEREMAINALAPMHITLALMPMLRSRPAAHIVNIASAASMLGNPRMSVYVASKWSLGGWSDSLRIELAELRPIIRVTRINPFYIATGMFAGVRSPIIPIMTPEAVIPRIIRAIERNALSLQLPWIVNILPFVRSILPSPLFDLIVGKWLGVYHTMDKFTGRQQPPTAPS